MLQKGSLNYLAKEVFLPEMLFSYSLNLSTSQKSVYLTETIGIGTKKKNVSKARGIVESKYTFKRVSFLYSVPQTCYIAPSCWSRAAKSNDLSPLTVAYPHILLLYHILNFYIGKKYLMHLMYYYLAYTLKARKYHVLSTPQTFVNQHAMSWSQRHMTSKDHAWEILFTDILIISRNDRIFSKTHFRFSRLAFSWFYMQPQRNFITF